MTNAKVTPEEARDERKCLREKTPYTLPDDPQLLSYWHYQNNAGRPKDSWHFSIKQIRDGSGDDGATQSPRRKTSDSLIEELRGKSGSTFGRSRYVEDMRQLTRWRLLVGQKRDGCLQIDQQLDIEHAKYLDIKRQYKECTGALERFLAADHDASMRLLSRAAEESARTAELSRRRDELSRRYGQARLAVYRWEEEWRTVKACHRFLHRVTPAGAEHLAGQSDEEASDGPDDHADAEADHQEAAAAAPRRRERSIGTTSDITETTNLHGIIDVFEKEANDLARSPAKSPRDLGLTVPRDLLRLFRTVEVQNLNALIHLESLDGPMADMIARIDVAETRVRSEIDDVIEGIKQLEMAIDREEKRAQRLKRLSNRLVQSSFRALICSEEALHARVLVEEAYEACVAPNEAGLEALAMARGLESAYERLSADLDRLPRHLVVACEREGFQQEGRENREAEDAARKFELMHRLLAALRRLMEPLEPKHRKLMRRSPPTLKLKHKTKGNETKEQLTQRDALHLDFFGKLCKSKKGQASDSDEEDGSDDAKTVFTER